MESPEPRARAGAGWTLPPRFVLFLACAAVVGPMLVELSFRWSQAILGAFDMAALLFTASLWSLTRDDSPAQMRADAQANDSNRFGVLVITTLVMLVIVTAVAVELPEARKLSGNAHIAALLLVLASLVIAWLFSNLIFALHYAHMFYREDGIGGLIFPHAGEQPHCPDYGDFIYFALTIGMAFATSDVEICRPDIRRTATLHSAVAFFYNLVVLAFTINVTASS
jgi:uncharacterized membrane protein